MYNKTPTFRGYTSQSTMFLVVTYIYVFQTLVGLCLSCYVFPEGQEDPCKVQECGYGAICERSKDGKSKRCLCATRCDTYGDNLGGKPVCGDNGKDYNSTCELKRDSCMSMVQIKIKYYGECGE